VAKPTEPVSFKSAEFKLKEADKAFEPEMTPVVVIAPELLTCIKVVEPETNAMFPLLSYCITLVKPDADLFLPIVVCYNYFYAIPKQVFSVLIVHCCFILPLLLILL
jgi:hypothetical protein